MKTISFVPLAAAFVVLSAPLLHAQSYTWDPLNTGTGSDASGTWTASNSVVDWSNGSTDVSWPNTTSDIAVFGSSSTPSGNYNINVGTVNAGGLTFNNTSGAYQLTNGTINGSGEFDINVGSSEFFIFNSTFSTTFKGATSYDFIGGSTPGNGLIINGATTFDNNVVIGTGSDVGEIGWSDANALNSSVTGHSVTINQGWSLFELYYQDSDNIVLSSFGTRGNGAFSLGSNGGQYTGSFTLTADSSILNNPGTNDVNTISGNINGTGNLFLGAWANGGTGDVLIISGTNTYAGNTVILNSSVGTASSVTNQIVQLGSNYALPSTTTLVVGENGTSAPLPGMTAPHSLDGSWFGESDGALDMHGFNATVSGLATGQGVTNVSNNLIFNNAASTTSTLTVSGTTTPTTGFGATIEDNTGTGGKVAVALTSGSLTLTGTNTYSGGTSVTGGILYVNNTSGSGTGTGNVAVTSTSGSHPVLAGSGTITPSAGNTISVGPGATLSSGAVQTSDATHETVTGKGLTFVNSAITSGTFLSVAAGSTLQFSLGAGAASDPGSTLNYETPNTNSTYLTVTGNQAGEINFGLGSSITISLIDLTALDSTSPNTLALRYNQGMLLIDAGLDSDYANLVTTGGVDQNGYVLGVGTSNASPSDYTPFTITMTNINGGTVTTYNDLGLYLYNGQLEIVPEPSTWALMIGGLGLLLFLQRRRRVRAKI